MHIATIYVPIGMGIFTIIVGRSNKVVLTGVYSDLCIPRMWNIFFHSRGPSLDMQFIFKKVCLFSSSQQFKLIKA